MYPTRDTRGTESSSESLFSLFVFLLGISSSGSSSSDDSWAARARLGPVARFGVATRLGFVGVPLTAEIQKNVKKEKGFINTFMQVKTLMFLVTP